MAAQRKHLTFNRRSTMHSKTRIAALVAALVFGAQAGVAAIEELAPAEPSDAVVERADAAPAEPAAIPEPAAAPERIASAGSAAPSASEPSPGFAQATATAVRGWYDRFTVALRNSTPPPVFPSSNDAEVEMWLMPTQIAYFERLEQQRLASLQPQPQAPAAAQPAAAEVQSQYGTTNLVAAHEVAAGAVR
jgi:hypothetical protein